MKLIICQRSVNNSTIISVRDPSQAIMLSQLPHPREGGHSQIACYCSPIPSMSGNYWYAPLLSCLNSIAWRRHKSAMRRASDIMLRTPRARSGSGDRVQDQLTGRCQGLGLGRAFSLVPRTTTHGASLQCHHKVTQFARRLAHDVP